MDLAALFKAVAVDAKGKATSPTAGTNEWNQWLEWTNEEYRDWGEVHDWEELRVPNFEVTSAQSGTSCAIPGLFKKIGGALVLGGSPYQEVDHDSFDLYSSTQKVFRHGYNNLGHYLEWKDPQSSGCSGWIPLICYPTALATTTDQIAMRNPYYLVKRLKVRIFKYRQSPIFTELEAEADLLLQQMIENEYYKHNQYKGGILTAEEEMGFILGED
jgi:hypothetical protein